MKILRRSFLLAGFLLAGFLTLAAQTAPPVPTPKTVLVLSPFQLDLSTNLIAAQAMREEFGKAADLNLDVYYEYLDLNRFPDPAAQQKIIDLLSSKYNNKPVDLVIVGSEAMLKLWLAQRAEILPHTPVVFFDVFTEHLGALGLPADLTGVSGVEDCEKSVRWALDALPAVNEIVLVGGVGKIEQGFFDHLQELQDDLQGRVKFTNLSGLPLSEIKQRVSKLPKTSIVLYHPLFEDAEGNKYRPLDVLRQLTAVSSVPVIGGYDQFIGTGILGGFMYSIDQQARDAAQIGLRVLRGEVLSSIPIAQDESNRFIFDHPALQRFDIPLSALPPNSIIKNRQYSFWELYQPQIIAASTGFVVLLLLVVFLLGVTRQLYRTRLALAQLNVSLETQVQERTALLHETNTRLQDEITERKQAEEQLRESERRLTILLSNLPGMAYRCRNDLDWTMEFVSEGCSHLTGYAVANLIDSRSVVYGRLIHPNDQAQVWENVQAAVRARAAYDLVYRIITASGVEKWVMERGRGVFTEQGDLLALEGFISDITQQKYIEQSLRHAHAESEVRMHARTMELTQANEALRQYEINFEAVVNNANDGISIATAAGETIFANARFAEIVGYPLAELSHTTMKDLAHPDEYPMLAERLRRRLAGESVPNQYETAIRQKDGHKVPIELTASKILWQGQPADLVIVRDITGRQQSEALIAIRLRLMEFAAVHSLEELLQRTLDEVSGLVNSPIAFYHIVEADQITLSLQSWSTRTEEEFCTAAGKGLHYNIDRAGVWVDAVHQKQPVIHNDYAALPHRKGLPEGHAAVIRELVVPILRDNKVVAILGVGNKPTGYTDQDISLVAYLADVAWEITARKKIEQELQQYRDHLEQLVQTRTAELVTANELLAQEVQERKINLAKYTTLFEAFPLGVTIAATDGKILESNQEAERILGIARHEQEQRTVGGSEWHIIRPDGTRMPAEEFASVRALKEQSRIENIEMGIVDGDQQITWINVTAAPIPAEGLGIAVVYSDITERKRTEEALRESEERFRSLLDSQESSIMMLDFDGVHHYANQSGVDSISSSGTAQDIIGKRLHDLYPAPTADWQLEQIRQVFTTGQGLAGDFENFQDDQSTWWHLNLQPIHNASGQVAQVMVNSLNITERKHAEQALRESEERFHSLADTAPVLIWMSGTDTLCSFLNQPWLDFTGRTMEQELGNGWTEGIHADDLQRCLDTYFQAFHTRQPFKMEYRMRRADGEYRWIEDHGVPRFLPDGSFIGYIASSLDISDRKRFEEELRDSEKRTATILRLSPVVIGVSTIAEGRYTDVNDAFERVLGYSQAEAIGSTSFDLNLWADDTNRPQILRQIQAHGRVDNLEIRLRRKSGDIFPALVFITPIALHNAPCLLTMMMDITERKQAEEQLRETHDALQTIIHSSPLAILALDPEDRVTMWNPAAEAMFGWSEKQILGQINPTVPENKINEYTALRYAALSGMAFSNLDTLRMKKDGTQFPVSLSVAPLRGQQMQVIGRMHVIADITERKRLQEELRQQAMTDELTSVSNRRHFMELAHTEIKRAVRFKRIPAIALIDIDHFKQVNDTFGHAAGDQALVSFTKMCRKLIREIDVFARFGGDEFVLLLPETNQAQAYEVLERIRLALMTQPIDLDGEQVALTISSGIASLSGDQDTIDTLISQADQALYRAKEAGRNKVVRYDKLCE